MEKISETEIVPGSIYQHYKGNLYRVLGIGKHTETSEDVVLYEALYRNPLGRWWCRPVHMWHELVEFQGEKMPRFRLGNLSLS